MLDLRRYDEAASLLARLVAADPDEPRAWCLLSAARLAMGGLQDALAAANRGAELAPVDDWPHRLACLALIGLGQASEALRAADTASNLAPQSWQAHVCRARAAIATGAYANLITIATEAAAAARALAPNEPDVHLVSGQVSLARGNLKAARAHQERALALDPENSQALNELGLISALRRDARAAQYFVSALRIAPSRALGSNVEITVRNTVRLTIVACEAMLLAQFFLIGNAHLTHAAVIAGFAVVVGIAFALGAIQIRRLRAAARILAHRRRLQAAVITCYSMLLASVAIVSASPASQQNAALGLVFLLLVASQIATSALLRRKAIRRRSTSGRLAGLCRCRGRAPKP